MIFIFSVAPMIWVQNQLEMAAVGQNITIQCSTESFPKAIHYWAFGNESSPISVGKGNVFRTPSSVRLS